MIIFHHDDADGITAAAVTFLEISNDKPNCGRIKFVKMNYPKVFPTDLIEQGERVFIVDLSFTKNNIEESFKAIFDKTKDVTWIDHHDSSIESEHLVIGKYPIKGIRNKSYCGAYLAYFYFNAPLTLIDVKEEELKAFEEHTPEFVKIVDLWDSWKLVDNRTRAFMARFKQIENDITPNDINWGEWLSNEPIGDIVDNKYVTASELAVNNFVRDGSKVVTFEDSQFAYIMQYAFNRNIGGTIFRCVNSVIGNSLLFGEDFYKYDSVLKFYYSPKENVFTCSIYSHKDSKVNCKEIAESFNGGGHQHAAGFKLDVSSMEQILDEHSFINEVWTCNNKKDVVDNG